MPGQKPKVPIEVTIHVTPDVDPETLEALGNMRRKEIEMDDCWNCNGTGYVREGYDGEAPCEFCNHDNFVNWLREQWRLAEMEVAALKHKSDTLRVELDKADGAGQELMQEERESPRPGC